MNNFNIDLTKKSDLQIASLNKFKEFGLPNKKFEKWHYVPISSWLSGFSLNDSLDIESNIDSNINKSNLVFVNGVFKKNLSINIKGIEVISSKVDAVSENYDLSDLNIIASTEKVIINVSEKFDIDKEITINYFCNTNSKDNELSAGQIEFNIEKNSVVNVDFVYNIGASGGHILAIKANLLENSKLNITESIICDDLVTSVDNLKCVFLKFIEVSQFKNSNFKLLSAIKVKNDIKIRNEIYVNLLQPAAVCKIDGIFTPVNSQYFDNYITVLHSASHTKSNVFYRGVAKDKSIGNFCAKAIVAKDIFQIIAHQNNANLILGDKATINTKPELEIYSDDVVCSHGATIGQLDEEAIFFMQTRGINRKEAIDLLIDGFTSIVFER